MNNINTTILIWFLGGVVIGSCLTQLFLFLKKNYYYLYHHYHLDPTAKTLKGE